MPYRNESRSTEETSRIYCRFGSSYYFDTTVVVPKTSALQYGWRSFGEEEAARAALAQVQSGARWGDTSSVIAAFERIERATSNPWIRPDFREVHERRYSLTDWTDAKGIYSDPGREWTTTFGLDLHEVVPYAMSDAYIRSKGSEMLRSSRPTYPHASLGQWVGELRDFHSLFTNSGRAMTRDRNMLKAAGSGWLGYQFGWKPFIGDLIKSAEAILNATEYINQFLRDSGRLVYRKRSQMLAQDSWQSEGIYTSPPDVWSFGQNQTFTQFSTPYGNAMGRYRSGVGYDGWRGAFKNLNITSTTEIRTFAKFEYFSFDPDGFLDKLSYYEQNARFLLGLNLTPDLIWELTPWSWMLDWFFDLGGFLSYQVSVENDSLVMRQSGAVMEQNTSIAATCYAYYGSDPTVPLSGYDKPFYNVNSSKRTQIRLPSGPYDMGTTWDLSNSQWYIIGALGLTRAPGRMPIL